MDSGACVSGRKAWLPHEVIAVFNDEGLQLSNYIYTRELSVHIRRPSKTIPAALSIPTATINRFHHHCARTMDANRNGLDYGTKAFAEYVHKSHRQVVDKSKW